MFRCFDCGKSFDNDEILELKENDGFREGPHRTSFACPYCKGNHYRPFIKDKVSRRRVVDELLDVLLLLNSFDTKLCSIFNNCATDDTELDFARSKLYEFLVELAENEDFDLPKNIDDKVFGMKTVSDAAEVMNILTRNIEGD